MDSQTFPGPMLNLKENHMRNYKSKIPKQGKTQKREMIVKKSKSGERIQWI